ncbi:uncharacterized protein LOC102801757 [Saccoglossus kowalevskii]|uniref:Uncharacterized protein LOC102801757 n=1 Tax=Saccoglossus kowalevskii TaxID=10224 RepID=A0ABM0MCP9_SACKO|nr:PREDICTED: uncharacterized protein LOC102801757 [Saccoglossus kowalevskii]
MACPLVIITNAVVCLTLTLGAHVEALTCDGGHSPKYLSHDPYGNQMCQKCSKCPPGSGVSVECQGSRDTVCERCPEGTYSGTWSATRICLPCTMCSPHQRTIRECTSTRNAKCVKNCDVGFYLDTLSDNCEMCSWCFPDRPELFTPRLDDCMRSEIPVDYQCMQSAYEHRPFVMSSRSESTLPVTNQEYSEDREAVQLGDTGDGNSKDAMFNIVTAKDRFGVATTKNFLSRGTTIPTCKGNERDLTKVNTGPPIGMLTRIDVEQTEKWKSAAHHTPIIIMILSIITTIAIAIPIAVLITYRNRRITRSKRKNPF